MPFGFTLSVPVEDRVEAPVVRDPVLLAVVLAGLDHERVQVLEVRDQRGVPRLDEAARREVLDPADVRAEEVGLEAGVDLRERVRLVGHVGELRLVARVLLHVLREHGLAAVVAVARPVEDLEAPALGGKVRARCARDAGASSDEPGSAGDRRQLQEFLAVEPPSGQIVLRHGDVSFQ